jgi:serine/threonine protein kinase
MQYVKGPTLEEKLAAEGPLPIPAAKKVLAQVASALASAHRKGFVHRDVSPANVLCDAETDRVLLTDFGLAGLLPQKEVSLPRVTKKGEILGTPGFGSPEQLRGEDPTEGTDIYALGALGYEILTGEGPFRAKTVPDAAAAHLHRTPRPLAGLRQDVGPELADLLERCLAKDPGKRPSAEFLAQELTKESRADREPARAPEEEDVFKALIRRRMLWILSIAGVIGLGFLYIIRMLASRGLLPEAAFPLALDTVLCGLAAATVLAWFHGEKGRQKVAPFEVVLLTVIGLIWVAVGIAVLVP